MLGYYKSLLIACKRRKIFYFWTSFFVISLIIIGINLFVYESSISIKNNMQEEKFLIYKIAVPTISFLFYPLMWYFFYKDIYNNSIGSNIEILSFTSGLTRQKIFMTKLLCHFTLSTILTTLVTIAFFLVSLNIYSISNGKIWLFSFLSFITSIACSVIYFIMMFFCDTLSKKPRKKYTLGLSVIFSTYFIFAISLVITSGSKELFLNSKLKEEGIDDFENTSFLTKNILKSDPLLISTQKKYLNKNSKEKEEWVDKNLNNYQKFTNNLKIIDLFANILNLFNIIKNSQGIETNYVNGEEIFNYYYKLPSQISDSLYFLKLNNNEEKFYFKTIPWKYGNLNFKDIKKEKEEVESKIDFIISSLKTNIEFNKVNPEWDKIINFLKPKIKITFNIQKESIKYADENIVWLATFIYIKALKNSNKKLQFNNSDTEKELFYKNFISANQIFAYKTRAHYDEKEWVNWIVIFIIISGMGYWTIQRYKKMDII